MLTLAKSPHLTLKKASYNARHVTLAQVYSSLKDMRRYTLGASFKGKKQVFNLEPMTYKQAMVMRSKYTYYPHLSIEIIRLGV